MRNPSCLVINTSPLVALGAALGDLNQLGGAFEQLVVPGEVLEELEAGSHRDYTAQVVQNSGFFRIRPVYAILPPFLLTSLGRGEAAVIHTAVSEGIETVAIDERKGRRWARLHGLKVTGSLGIIVVLHRMGVVKSVAEAIGRMNAKGIFLSEALIQAAMDSANKP